MKRAVVNSWKFGLQKFIAEVEFAPVYFFNQKLMGNEVCEIEVPGAVVERWRKFYLTSKEIPDDVIVRTIRERIAEQARLFIESPGSVQMDIGTARRILGSPDEIKRALPSHIIVGMGIIEADKEIHAKVVGEGAEASGLKERG